MGDDAHLLHYAIGRHGDDVNFFAVVEGPLAWADERSWVVPATLEEAQEEFAGWHTAVAEMLQAARVDRRWGLFVNCRCAAGIRGPAVLIGDAAHAMLPLHGEGANASIEDACVLAGLLPTIDDREDALATYTRMRRTRTRTIQRSAWDANRALHAVTSNAKARRQTTLENFPERFGWIHDYDAQRALGDLRSWR